MYRKIYPLTPALFGIAVIYIISSKISPEDVGSLAKQFGLLAPTIIVLSGVITNIIAPLSGTPAMVAGFYLYRHEVVFLMTISSLISQIINFWIARKLGRSWVQRTVGQENMKKVDEFTKEHGAVSLFFMRLFLGGFHDYISYAMGLTNMSFGKYYKISLIAAIPGTAIWYFIMLKAQNIVSFTILTYAVAGISVLVFLFSKKLIRYFHFLYKDHTH